mgnify:CR=1 FL=1
MSATLPPRELERGRIRSAAASSRAGALGLWVTPEAWRERVLEELLSYAAITLAFLGAIHWGLAMRAEEKSQGRFILSFSLIAVKLFFFFKGAGRQQGRQHGTHPCCS